MPNKMIQPHDQPEYKVVWPLGKSAAAAPVKLGAPVPDLNGKTVGELWHGKFRGDAMFTIIRRRLQERFPNVNWIGHSTFGNFDDPDEAALVAALPELLRQQGCDAVIAGVGA